MNKEMKMVYTSPRMECTQIESEGTFASSIVTKEKSDVKTTEQEYHEIDAGGQWVDGSGKSRDNVTWE